MVNNDCNIGGGKMNGVRISKTAIANKDRLRKELLARLHVLEMD
jgi:hypothetical protein